MDISDWFTILGIILAVVAIYPSTERSLISLKLHKYELLIISLLFLFVLYLIKFNELSGTLTLLQVFSSSWGLKPENWALILFLLILLYSSWRIFHNISLKLPNKKTIAFYNELMRQNFEEFLRLFLKYEKKSSNEENYDVFKSIIFNPKFLSEISIRIPNYHNNLIKKMDNDTIRPYFNQIINNKDSIFYKEIALNDNSDLVENNNEFLFELLHANPQKFIDIGGLLLIRSWYLKHLQNEKINSQHSIYNQPPELLIDDYKFQLTLYYPINFIGLLYNEAINQKIDISTLSSRYTNMQAIFSLMIEKMIDNIDKEIYQLNFKKEYPTNYHFLISKIFSIVGNWFSLFIDDEKYEDNNSLIIFIPFCFRLCATQLFEGNKKGVITVDFIKRIYSYHLMDVYFDYNIKSRLISEINEKCLKIIPKEFVEPILKYCLDERLALSYYDFRRKDFSQPTIKKYEEQRLNDLYEFLEKHDKMKKE